MEKDLLKALTAYAEKDYYPFHMPGHKRNTELCQLENPYRLDITEIDGFDNLHDAQGIIKLAMEEAAELYHAEETYFLVNGSTCGILAAIHTCTKPGDMVLVARNCHKAVYHALYLQRLSPVYLYPQMEQGILSEILPESVEHALKQYPEIRAVIITSPTYEGVVSDIEKIADLAHSFGCPLIVDEAHGAHFGFSDGFPETAVHLGADLVIQSVHKTLPAFTQSALLHIGKGKQASEKQASDYDRIDKSRLRHYLSIFQSSSPSYLLMAGIQNSLRLVKERGDILFPQLLEHIAYLRKRTEHLRFLHILSLKNSDPSKILIFIEQASGRNGHWLYRILLEKYHLQMEMESLQYVLAMTGIADTREGFERLADALQEIDQDLHLSCQKEKKDERENDGEEKKGEEKQRSCSIQEALDSKKEMCPLNCAAGSISAEYIYLYPPGIPLIVPGEVFSEEMIVKIKEYLIAGLEVKGIFKDMVSIMADAFKRERLDNR